MEPSMHIENWQLFTDRRFELTFHYPATTPRGHAVEKTEGQQDDVLRVHLVSRDSQELYFEVVKYPNLLPREEYEQHRAYLEQRFDDLAITELKETSLASQLAYAYSFKWGNGERAVLLIHKDRATYRIIYDPHSPLNPQLLSTIEFID